MSMTITTTSGETFKTYRSSITFTKLGKRWFLCATSRTAAGTKVSKQVAVKYVATVKA